MGQQASTHLQAIDPHSDILSRQRRLYQWRADSNFNGKIARVAFKSAFAQHQEERFAQFLHQQETKDYLQLYKFKDYLQNMSGSRDQKIVIFEKYHSTLSKLKAQLEFQETIYLLDGLLVGYQQIKKIYEKIVVDSTCCFVTMEGEIRAWINPNPRLNQMWSGQFGQLSGQSLTTSIIIKTIKLGEQSGKPSQRSQIFFSQLLNTINNLRFKNWTFGQIRQWINEYCYFHGIQMARKVDIDSKQQLFRPSINEVKQSFNIQYNIDKEQHPFSNQKKNPLFASTQESQFLQNSNRRSLLLKSKSLDRNVIPMQYISANIITEISNNQNRTQQTFIQSQSEIMHRRSFQQPIKFSYMLPSSNEGRFGSQNQVNKMKECNVPCTSNSIKNGMLKDKPEKVPFKSNSSSQMHINSKVTQQGIHKVTQQGIQIVLNSPKKERITKKLAEKQKNSMQLSIMNAIPQQIDEKENNAQIPKLDVKRRTSFIPKVSMSGMKNSDMFSRPWITTKTINRLISENSNQSSLQHSIAESSDYYNSSDYSGVLTQMGRDVTKQVQPDVGGKTLSVSKQL